MTTHEIHASSYEPHKSRFIRNRHICHVSSAAEEGGRKEAVVFEELNLHERREHAFCNGLGKIVAGSGTLDPRRNNGSQRLHPGFIFFLKTINHALSLKHANIK